jgi:hypothetical protein
MFRPQHQGFSDECFGLAARSEATSRASARLSNRSLIKTKLAFALVGQDKRPRPRRLSWQASLQKYFGVDPLIDSHGQFVG